MITISCAVEKLLTFTLYVQSTARIEFSKYEACSQLNNEPLVQIDIDQSATAKAILYSCTCSWVLLDSLESH